MSFVDLDARDPEKREGFGIWWLGSIALHGTLFAGLLVLNPTPNSTEITSAASADQFTATAAPDRVQEVVKDIRAQQADEFEERLAELNEAKHDVETAAQQKLAQYAQSLGEVAGELPEKLSAGQQQVEAAQDEALKAQQDAAAALARLKDAKAAAPNSAEADAAAKAAGEAQQRAKAAQQRSSTALSEIARKMEFISPAAAEAKQAQAEVLQAQSDAEAAQEAALKARQAATGEIPDAAKAEKEAQKLVADAEEARRVLQSTENDLGKAQQAQTDLEAKVSELRPATEAAKAATDQSSDATKKTRDAPKALDKAEKDLVKAKDRVTKQQARVAQARTNSELRSAKAEAAGAGVGGQGGDLFSRAENAQREALATQHKARDAQTNAHAKLNETISMLGAKNLVSQPSVSAASAAREAQSPAPSQAKDIPSLYENAKALEAQISESYKMERAADLAINRQIPFSEALKLTEVAKPERPDLDSKLLTENVRDGASLAAHAKAIQTVSAEMQSMVSLARRMAELSKPDTEGQTVSLASARAQSAHYDQMEQVATEDEGAAAKDVSSLMQGAAGAGTGAGTGGSGTGAAGGSQGAGSSESGASGSGTGGASTGGQGASGSGGGGSGAGIPETGAAGAGGAGHGGSGGSGGPDSARGLAGELGKTLKSETPRDLRPIPGRRVGSGDVTIEAGRRPEWLYVDSWYLIGPWPNAGRQHIDTKFPPETVVDLDAIYITDANQPVRWKFYQSPSEFVVPPGIDEYQIFYAYTELWFDEAKDLWVAIGSDDQSRVWVEDQLIWKSRDEHKKWNATEGFRKVHFKKGLNRVLVRLENGHGKGGFSFIVNLNENFGG